MRRRDLIHALCSLLGLGTLGARRAHAAAPRQILLAGMHVAGTAYYDAEAAVDRLRPGQLLGLRRDPENRYDALAIEIFGPQGHKLGYVPRGRNEMPARLLDAGNVCPRGPNPSHGAGTGCTSRSRCTWKMPEPFRWTGRRPGPVHR